uniref:UDENN domain-containing protein n=1 Tax=Chrysotila carterae TaxID=13221 RepID=A0A7S4BW60_CHRCT|mmetsp:Transcript_1737/g.3640  ORF Transcript_1737/g.3640 Transcript_1737/m.3640 type:complete len:451 (-) Transcript_1737:133-1485(-)
MSFLMISEPQKLADEHGETSEVQPSCSASTGYEVASEDSAQRLSVGSAQAWRDGSSSAPRMLGFALTTWKAERLHGVALSWRGARERAQDAVLWRGHSLVLLGQHYLPAQLAACAYALLPLAMEAVEAPAGAGATTSALSAAASALVKQPGLRCDGVPRRVRCANETVDACVPPCWALLNRCAEPPDRTLALLGVDGYASLLAAVLLEQKVLIVSDDASRLASAAHAASSLCFPLRWSHVLVPVLPPSHTAVVSAPFPYLLGISRSTLAELDSGALSPRPHLGMRQPGRFGELRVMLDEGKAWGEALEPLPPRQAALFARTLAADAKGGYDATAQRLELSCLTVLASILKECMAMASSVVVGVDELRRDEGRHPLDMAAAKLSQRFLEAQDDSSRKFAKLLCETTHFQHFLGQIVQPRELWPSFLRQFERFACGQKRFRKRREPVETIHE